MQNDALARLTSGGGFWYSPIWSPDGRYILFDSVGKGIFQARADGATPPELLLESKGDQEPWSFTPDGKWLAYGDYAAQRSQIWIVPVQEQDGKLKAGPRQQFLKSNFDDGLPIVLARRALGGLSVQRVRRLRDLRPPVSQAFQRAGWKVADIE